MPLFWPAAEVSVLLSEHGRLGLPLAGHLVIDAHGHLGTYGAFDIPASTPEAIVAIMDRIGVRALCASHLMALVGDCRAGNDLLAEAMRRYPGRFIGYAVANPNRPEEIEPELERCRQALGMRGIKVHAGFAAQPVDSPGFWRMYEWSAAHGNLPVLGHGFDDAAAMERIALAFPQVPFIVAHAGGAYRGGVPDPVILLAARLDNIYLDLCSSLAYEGALERLVRLVGAQKLLFGSDLCFQQATQQVGRVLFADISEPDKEAILGLNAAQLFGLPQETAV
jgi:predicted TIM-barrel fold metal-dependent hydrolase